MYDFEPKQVREFIKENNVEKPAIQLPNGLKEHLSEILKPYKEMNLNPIIIAENCFGACDLADHEAKQVGCDALIHYGHADMGFKTEIPVLYVECRLNDFPKEVLEETLPLLENSKWGLTTTVQHINNLEKIKNFLSSNEISAVIGPSSNRTKYPGQVLGCDWKAAKSISQEVDGVIYLGTGHFHPVGIALATGKDVVIINPSSKGHEIVSPDLENFLDQRKAMLSKAASKEYFGIILCSKIGQQRLKLAEELKNDFESKDYRTSIILLNDLSPEKLSQFRDWAFVSTACPRIALDDAENYDNPILTPFEAKVLLGKEDLEPYQLDDFC